MFLTVNQNSWGNVTGELAIAWQVWPLVVGTATHQVIFSDVKTGKSFQVINQLMATFIYSLTGTRVCLYFAPGNGEPKHYSKVVAAKGRTKDYGVYTFSLFCRGHRNRIGINGPRLTRPLWVFTVPDDYMTTTMNKHTNYELKYKTCKYLFCL